MKNIEFDWWFRWFHRKNIEINSVDLNWIDWIIQVIQYESPDSISWIEMIQLIWFNWIEVDECEWRSLKLKITYAT